MCKKPEPIGTDRDKTKDAMKMQKRRRRTKRERKADVDVAEAAAAAIAERQRARLGAATAQATAQATTTTTTTTITMTRTHKSGARRKHENDAKSGGIDSLLPSIAGVLLLCVVAMAKMGFRGRADVAGIDLGTTNSVVCVQSPSKSVGTIECVPDPATGSPIVPSVVSFMDRIVVPTAQRTKKKASGDADLDPHPVNVVVGGAAKARIDTHPHHTLYHAKRVIGRSFGHESVRDLMGEVEFEIVDASSSSSSSASADYENENEDDDDDDDNDTARFRIPYHAPAVDASGAIKGHVSIKPQQVGSYIVNHLIQMTRRHLGHDNVRTAVIAIPAKFEHRQRLATIEAFRNAGIAVARILEEPTAAALAYGLDKKDGVDHIMVYDFGGGTLDVSVLHVSEGGYVDVMGSDGDDRLGGADFDAAVARYLLRRDGGSGEAIVASVSEALRSVERAMLRDRAKNAGGTNAAAAATTTTTTTAAAELDAAEDLEELLADACPALEGTPACTRSSFHTIGERLKISLSTHPGKADTNGGGGGGGGGVATEHCLGIVADGETRALPTTVENLCSILRPIELTLTSAEYDDAVQDLYGRSLLPIRRLLSDLNLSTDEIDEVVMVGGTTRMPRIRELVKEELGVPSLNTHIDPDLTVAYGAASVID